MPGTPKETAVTCVYCQQVVDGGPFSRGGHLWHMACWLVVLAGRTADKKGYMVAFA